MRRGLLEYGEEAPFAIGGRNPNPTGVTPKKDLRLLEYGEEAPFAIGGRNPNPNGVTLGP